MLEGLLAWGSVGNFAAKKASAASQRLESMGRDGNLDSAGEALLTLESELKILSNELRSLTRDTSMRKKTNAEGWQTKKADMCESNSFESDAIGSALVNCTW